ncbi:fumarate reductase [Stemphylium lycopersici]|nr:fumarate reductase [Stemphylium lycopersici]
MPERVIVVGAGLSGLSAAHTIYLAGGNVVLLDKNNFMGGNSTKATSGINGALTRTQVDEKIGDSVKQFYDDTLKSARDKARPDLIKVLTYKSAAAVEWLMDVFNLDLTLVSRLGGHSQPRTHRGHDAKFPGMAITYALMQRFEELAEQEPERVQLVKKAKVLKVNTEGNRATGVTYSFNGEETTLDGPVILATGGYAADFTEDSLLKKWRPDTYDLSTTNGAHATGDGHKMLMKIGANGIDMDKVQVHPTGLVDPKDPTAKTKFLAAEALRGEGGILLNSKGKRFCDDLGHRDYVSGMMWGEKEKGNWPIRLVLNSKASNILDFHTRHYSGRGLMKKMTGKELAKEIGVSDKELQSEFQSYNSIAKGEKKDEWNKKYFHNLPFDINDTFHVAQMEPVLHFTMGGIEINDQAQCLNSNGEPFDGLYVCGELAGGVHGANRLGGSSLLGCVVYGRVAGESASKYLFQQALNKAGGAAVSRLGQISLHIDPSQPGKVSVEWGNGVSSSQTGVSSSDPVAQQKQESAGPVMSSQGDSNDPGKVSKPNAPKKFSIPDKEFSLEEVAKHNKKDDLWIAVKGIVMDVTNWTDEHPGGPQALFSHMGKDASEEFEMLHDDEVIPKYAPEIVIGKVKGQETMTTYDEYGVPVGAYSEPESLTHQAWRLARAFFLYRIRPAVQERRNALQSGNWSLRRLFTLVNALVVLWWTVLYWGERGVFNSAIESCDWDKWEDWEAGANPHRLIFVADPQLIDPHTYPGRPWPLNPLTYKYTDLYLRRTYSRLQTILYPDTVFFLGDLFDGGREWSTRTTTSPEEQYRKYGDDFWMNEYRRFGDLFFKHWGDGGMDARPGQPGRKLISSLPGNHDLGFARGVQVGVRDRFSAYFGDGNRIDVIANHTFVSIDSLSLSAFGQESPQQVEHIWRPTKEFLEGAKKRKKRLIQRELRAQQGLKPYPGMPHYEIKTESLAKSELPHANDDVTEFPTILLSHVPLYRAPGTPCGPLREHWPPTPPPPGEPPLEHDDRNAIAVRGGYQYQNVLNREITADIAEKVGNIRYAFSGDDHDYCEVVHKAYASAGGGIREITVKSISWAMGVRLPGVVMLSLWNPVDMHGNPLNGGDASKTVQTKLCILPDQIGTFLKYGSLFGLTLVVLLARAALVTIGLVGAVLETMEAPLLPTTNISSSAEHEKKAQQQYQDYTQQQQQQQQQQPHSSNSSMSSDHGASNLSVRKQVRYSFPLVQHAGYNPANDFGNDDDRLDSKGKVKIYGQQQQQQQQQVSTKPKKKRKGFGLFWYEFSSSLRTVVFCGLVWYVWLVWRG